MVKPQLVGLRRVPRRAKPWRLRLRARRQERIVFRFRRSHSENPFADGWVHLYDHRHCDKDRIVAMVKTILWPPFKPFPSHLTNSGVISSDSTIFWPAIKRGRISWPGVVNLLISLTALLEMRHAMSSREAFSIVADLEEPNLLPHLEFLYVHSIGYVGILKDWLNKAHGVALRAKAKTLTLAHLKARALSVGQCRRMLADARAGEQKLEEARTLVQYSPRNSG